MSLNKRIHCFPPFKLIAGSLNRPKDNGCQIWQWRRVNCSSWYPSCQVTPTHSTPRNLQSLTNETILWQGDKPQQMALCICLPTEHSLNNPCNTIVHRIVFVYVFILVYLLGGGRKGGDGKFHITNSLRKHFANQQCNILDDRGSQDLRPLKL